VALEAYQQFAARLHAKLADLEVSQAYEEGKRLSLDDAAHLALKV